MKIFCMWVYTNTPNAKVLYSINNGGRKNNPWSSKTPFLLCSLSWDAEINRWRKNAFVRSIRDELFNRHENIELVWMCSQFTTLLWRDRVLFQLLCYVFCNDLVININIRLRMCVYSKMWASELLVIKKNDQKILCAYFYLV